MRCYLTDESGAFQERSLEEYDEADAEMLLVVVRPDLTYQRIAGFGGAFTEAAAYTFALMPPREQDRFLRLCFGAPGDGGNGYTLGRLPLMSCDFSLQPLCYVKPFDTGLRTFSLGRDRSLLLPFARCGLAANPALQLVASPWSPPAFMKTNALRRFGGRLRKSCYGAWARLVARALAAWGQEGVPVSRVTVQNEPMAAQTWESCLFSASEEARFAAEHLRGALDAEGLGDVRILVWDHNTDRVFERAEEVFSAPGARAACDGVAFHWYSGDHFEQVREVAARYPEKELLFTEGCVEFTPPDERPATQRRKAEQYGHALIGQLNAGASGFLDWNLLLDERGGPNHVGNFCEAPIMYDRAAQQLLVNESFYYLGHVSRFVVPGSRRCFVSRYTDDIECAAFVRPDGGRVLVAMNRRDWPVTLRVTERPRLSRVEAPPHSILTLTWDAGE